MSRIGGDEFAIVQADVERPEQCSQLAASIVEAVSKPYDIDGKHIVIGTSIGIAIAPADGTNPDQLLKNADMALYLAKADGRGVHRFFEREMDERLQSRHLLELDLRKALVNGEFELHYQPIVTLENEKVIGFEALVRWNHPEQGLIPPLKFIPLAEETGLILPLGEWVLRTACAHAAKWPEPVGVAVNLSATQFRSRNLVQLTVNALAASGLPAYQLDLEITESVLLQDEANILAVLHQLREIGIRISTRRFRHRLFVARVSAQLPVRQDQDRSQLRAGHAVPEGLPSDRACGDRARAEPRHLDHHRGRGDPRAARGGPGRRLQRRAGLLARQADAQQRGRLVPCPTQHCFQSCLTTGVKQ